MTAPGNGTYQIAATADSGVLSTGQRHQFKLNAQGIFAYADEANPQNTVVIVVEGYRVYLPLIRR